ncbi:MAG: aminodeoxychorismate/anthranilate synthase component II [Bacteroidota bacterium]
MHILLIDNFDSFTYNLVDYLNQLGMKTNVVRNNTSLDVIDTLKFDAIVLSPGPGKPINAGITMQVIEKYYQSVPILGICLGHQALGEFFGWKLVKAKTPMHGKTSVVNFTEHPIFNQIVQPFQVMRYHSLLVEPTDSISHITSIANSIDHECMVLAHQSLPIIGFQFHPESILTKKGLQLLQNWIQYCKLFPYKIISSH